MPDTLQAAVVNNLLGFVKSVVSSRIVIRMDLVQCFSTARPRPGTGP